VSSEITVLSVRMKVFQLTELRSERLIGDPSNGELCFGPPSLRFLSVAERGQINSPFEREWFWGQTAQRQVMHFKGC